VNEVAHIASLSWGDGALYKFQADNFTEKRESSLLDLDSSRATKTLGWNPIWTQEEAIVSTISWWKKVLIQDVDAKKAIDSDIEKIDLLS
jgi:nucleoside-diphosphate-sugar epimerase